MRALQLQALGSAGLRPTHLRVLEKEQRGRRLRPPGRAARQGEVKGDMVKTRRVPEDLMGTILRGSAEPPGGDPLESAGPTTHPPAVGGGAISWEDQPWLVGTTFNLSKQVGRELDSLRLDLKRQEDISTSNSEIAEVALRIAIEDARERGEECELVKRMPQARRPGAAWTSRVTSSTPPSTRGGRLSTRTRSAT